jgi:hypothetical protein
MPLKARGGAPPDARPKQLQAVIKAAVGAGGEWVLDVLGAPFGSVLDKDGDGEWFDGATDFHPDQFGLPPAVYYHGWTPEGKPSTAPAYIGKTIRRWVDGAGVWFRVVLNKASAYARRVWEAAQQDRARASTGAIPHLARVSPSGHILEWPIGELSLLDVEGGRRPVNRHAVALPVMKALYDQAGMELPRAAYGVNPGCEREIRRHAGLWRCKELLRQIREMD